MIKSYLQYQRQAVNAHGIHSPFVYTFYCEVIKKRKAGRLRAVEKLFRQLRQSKQELQLTDFGAGSRRGTGNVRTLGAIALTTAVAPKYGSVLNRIVATYPVKNVLELGTSLGASTAYLASGSEQVHVHTLEGSVALVEAAQENLAALGVTNVSFYPGEFGQTLAQTSFKEACFDLIFIDGNHRLEPTLHYFEYALAHAHDDTFIIFDDIHWSKEMELAWDKIKQSEAVNVSMDLFQFGIVCKRPGQRKQAFTLKV